MSWEGYSQFLCGNGHFFTGSADLTDNGCWHDPIDISLARCPVCKEGAVLENRVNETNHTPGQGGLDLSRLLIEDERIETCNLGHQHVVNHARYRIPSPDELESLRIYYEEE